MEIRMNIFKKGIDFIKNDKDFHILTASAAIDAVIIIAVVAFLDVDDMNFFDIGGDQDV